MQSGVCSLEYAVCGVESGFLVFNVHCRMACSHGVVAWAFGKVCDMGIVNLGCEICFFLWSVEGGMYSGFWFVFCVLCGLNEI
jgi:hypothetical protein